MTSVGGPGIVAAELAERSFLRLRRVSFVHPKAADDDLIVTTVDPSTKAVGSTLTLAVSKLKYGRKLTMTLNDEETAVVERARQEEAVRPRARVTETLPVLSGRRGR